MEYYQTPQPSQNVRTCKNRNNHYNLFQFEEKHANRRKINVRGRYYSESEDHKQQTLAIVMANDVGYHLPLIANQLDLIVYCEGLGGYPAPGQYVQYKSKIYLENDIKKCETQTMNVMYGRGKNPEPIEHVLAISKQKFKARITMGPVMVEKMSILSASAKNGRIVIEMLVMAISDYPFDSSLTELEDFHAGVLRHSLEGDRAFENRNLERSLTEYERAVYKICSEYYAQTISAIKKQIKEQLACKYSENTQEYLRRASNLTADKNLQNIELIEQQADKITLKAIEVAVIAGQPFKVIKWAHNLMMNPNYQRNVRLLKARATAYAEMSDYERALADLKVMKELLPHDQGVQKQIARWESKRKQAKHLKQQMKVINSIKLPS